MAEGKGGAPRAEVTEAMGELERKIQEAQQAIAEFKTKLSDEHIEDFLTDPALTLSDVDRNFFVSSLEKNVAGRLSKAKSRQDPVKAVESFFQKIRQALHDADIVLRKYRPAESSHARAVAEEKGRKQEMQQTGAPGPKADKQARERALFTEKAQEVNRAIERLERILPDATIAEFLSDASLQFNARERKLLEFVENVRQKFGRAQSAENPARTLDRLYQEIQEATEAAETFIRQYRAPVEAFDEETERGAEEHVSIESLLDFKRAIEGGGAFDAAKWAKELGVSRERVEEIRDAYQASIEAIGGGKTGVGEIRVWRAEGVPSTLPPTVWGKGTVLKGKGEVLKEGKPAVAEYQRAFLNEVPLFRDGSQYYFSWVKDREKRDNLITLERRVNEAEKAIRGGLPVEEKKIQDLFAEVRDFMASANRMRVYRIRERSEALANAYAEIVKSIETSDERYAKELAQKMKGNKLPVLLDLLARGDPAALALRSLPEWEALLAEVKDTVGRFSRNAKRALKGEAPETRVKPRAEETGKPPQEEELEKEKKQAFQKRWQDVLKAINNLERSFERDPDRMSHRAMATMKRLVPRYQEALDILQGGYTPPEFTSEMKQKMRETHEDLVAVLARYEAESEKGKAGAAPVVPLAPPEVKAPPPAPEAAARAEEEKKQQELAERWKQMRAEVRRLNDELESSQTSGDERKEADIRRQLISALSVPSEVMDFISRNNPSDYTESLKTQLVKQYKEHKEWLAAYDAKGVAKVVPPSEAKKPPAEVPETIRARVQALVSRIENLIPRVQRAHPGRKSYTEERIEEGLLELRILLGHDDAAQYLYAKFSPDSWERTLSDYEDSTGRDESRYATVPPAEAAREEEEEEERRRRNLERMWNKNVQERRDWEAQLEQSIKAGDEGAEYTAAKRLFSLYGEARDMIDVDGYPPNYPDEQKDNIANRYFELGQWLSEQPAGQPPEAGAVAQTEAAEDARNRAELAKKRNAYFLLFDELKKAKEAQAPKRGILARLRRRPAPPPVDLEDLKNRRDVAKREYERARAEYIGDDLGRAIEEKIAFAEANINELHKKTVSAAGTEKKKHILKEAAKGVGKAWKYLGDLNLEAGFRKMGLRIPENRLARMAMRLLSVRTGIGAVLLGQPILAEGLQAFFLAAWKPFAGLGGGVVAADTLAADRMRVLEKETGKLLERINNGEAELDELENQLGALVYRARLDGVSVDDEKFRYRVAFRDIQAEYIRLRAEEIDLVRDDGRERSEILGLSAEETYLALEHSMDRRLKEIGDQLFVQFRGAAKKAKWKERTHLALASTLGGLVATTGAIRDAIAYPRHLPAEEAAPIPAVPPELIQPTPPAAEVAPAPPVVPIVPERPMTPPVVPTPSAVEVQPPPAVPTAPAEVTPAPTPVEAAEGRPPSYRIEVPRAAEHFGFIDRSDATHVYNLGGEPGTDEFGSTSRADAMTQFQHAMERQFDGRDGFARQILQTHPGYASEYNPGYDPNDLTDDDVDNAIRRWRLEQRELLGNQLGGERVADAHRGAVVGGRLVNGYPTMGYVTEPGRPPLEHVHLNDTDERAETYQIPIADQPGRTVTGVRTVEAPSPRDTATLVPVDVHVSGGGAAAAAAEAVTPIGAAVEVPFAGAAEGAPPGPAEAAAAPSGGAASGGREAVEPAPAPAAPGMRERIIPGEVPTARETLRFAPPFGEEAVSAEEAEVPALAPAPEVLPEEAAPTPVAAAEAAVPEAAPVDLGNLGQVAFPYEGGSFTVDLSAFNTELLSDESVREGLYGTEAYPGAMADATSSAQSAFDAQSSRLYIYDAAYRQLDAAGRGGSPEALYLREQIQSRMNNIARSLNTPRPGDLFDPDMAARYGFEVPVAEEAPPTEEVAEAPTESEIPELPADVRARWGAASDAGDVDARRLDAEIANAVTAGDRDRVHEILEEARGLFGER